MKQKDFLQLREEIVQRARVVPRPTSYQIQVERLRNRQLARFIRDRLDALRFTPASLARSLDVERELVEALLDAMFPVNELGTSFLNALAQSLRCDVGDLEQAMRVTNGDANPGNHPITRPIELPNEHTVDIDE